MGLTSSTAAVDKKTRLEYLGDRYPFGDSEIIRLAQCHAYLRRERMVRKSFLCDWAVYCASLPVAGGSGGGSSGSGGGGELENNRHHRRYVRQRQYALMQVVEGRILPSGFGRRLERAAFLLPPDVIDYRTSSMMMMEEQEFKSSPRRRRGDGGDAAPDDDDPYRGSIVSTTGGGGGGDTNENAANVMGLLPCKPCWTPGGGPD
eukprot:CAMPEP_0178600798 /NCGR_PEP_ID=MMETSP0697-20121206/34065_1 /TAXON_ID=265572 /ORGANISM="Extubocellulus spinifer, Strain CCMP396" /LENGTH=203 /DNA_ID=CAMNT_0020238851 /DNA_START=126 /DNA_END=734 /DNA_ORIENTATION=+